MGNKQQVMLEEEQYLRPGRSQDGAKGAGNVGEQEATPTVHARPKPQVTQPPRPTRALGRASLEKCPQSTVSRKRRRIVVVIIAAVIISYSNEHFLWAKNFAHVI